MINNLITICETSHTTHDAKDIVVGGVNADLGGLGTFNGGVGENKLEGGVIDAGEVAGARWLVFFWAKSEGVYVDTGVWGTSVVLVWLDKVEVGAFTFREAVLAVKLELSGDNWVFAPAVHVKRGFAEYEGTGIGYVRLFTTSSEVRVRIIVSSVPHVGGRNRTR